MPQDRKDLARQLRERAAIKPVQAPKAAPADKPWSIGGFAENAMNDAFEMVKGLFQMFPTAFKAGYDIVSDPKGIGMLMDRPEELGTAIGDTAVAVKDAILDPYQKHGFGVVYHRPVSTLLDVLTVVDLGAGALGRVGKIAGNTALVDAAAKLRAMPGSMARKAIDAGAAKFGLDLPTIREFTATKRRILGEQNVKAANAMDEVGRAVAELDDASRAQWHKWRTQGASAAELASNPAAAKALEAYRGFIEGVVQPRLKAARLLDDARMKDALVKKYMAETGADRAAAEAAIARAEVKPVYGPAIFEREGPVNFEEFLKTPTEARAGKVGFLEKFTGAEGAIKDPAKYVPKAIAAFHEVEGRLRLMEEIATNPKWVSAAKAGEGLGGAPTGIFQKYFEDRARAGGVKVGELQREGLGAEAIMKDRRVREAVNIVYDPTIKRLLQMEYTRWTGAPGAILRVYDAILGLFRKSATRWNPKWYTGNIVGDAMLGALAGADWATARALLNSKRKFGTVSGMNVASLEGGTLDRVTQIAGAADEAARAGIITKAFAEELKKAGLKFEMTAELAEEILKSSEEFGRVRSALAIARENIARQSLTVQKADALLEKLVARERAVAGKVADLEAVAQSPREAGIAERIKAIEAKKQAYLERLGIEKNVAAAARREIRQLVKHVPPDDLRRAVKQALARYNLAVADEQLDALIAATRQQADLASAFKAARAEVGLQRTRMAESVESRASAIDAARAKLENIRQRIVNVGTQREAAIADILDDAMKSEAFEARLPGLKQQDDIVRAGVEKANAFIGDYLGMTAFEQGVLRRIIPFYAWSKAMTMLAFRLPFLAPVKTFLWHRYSMAMMSMVGDPELPQWMNGYVPVFARENGDLVWFKLGAFSPFGGLRVTKTGNVPMPSVMDAMESNPIISLAVRLKGGRTVFDRSTLPYGEQMVNITNGDTYELTDQGTIRKTVPQAPLIGGIAHMFPITQFVEDVISPYQANSYNWLGIPQPALNPDGSYKYPREWLQRLAALAGVNLTVRSREDAIRAERVKVRQAMMALKGQYKRADPEEREFIRQAFADYQRGEYRRIESR